VKCLPEDANEYIDPFFFLLGAAAYEVELAPLFEPAFDPATDIITII
jgi:hypothetical protein